VILLLGGFGRYHGYSHTVGRGSAAFLALVVMVVLWLVGGVHV